MRCVKCLLLSVLIILIPMAVLAGNLDDPGAPTTAGGGAMNTLEDIYNILNDGTTNAPRTGTFAEPSAGPASTGHTLTDVYNRAKTSSRPAKTGQTLCYNAAGEEIGCGSTGQDGDELKGVAWPGTRFTDNTGTEAGTVTDNLTGLMWSKDASPEAGGSGVEQVVWTTALSYCYNLTLGGYSDWRLPNVKELQSLIDFGVINPALPSEYPFTEVKSSNYWSSTTLMTNKDYAWGVDLNNGVVHGSVAKSGACYVWPVRGGQ
jgi:hypothetical protein